jgi:hypothetical protein
MRITILTFLFISLTACESSNKKDTKNDSSTQFGGCLGLANGNKVRCAEYTSGMEIDAARKICGDESKGLKGYSWTNSQCPQDNRVGSCEYSEAGQTYATKDFWYAPTYTQESAKMHCLDFGGKFSPL